MCTSQSLFLPTYSYGFGRVGAPPGDDGIKPIGYQVAGCLKFTMLCLGCFYLYKLYSTILFIFSFATTLFYHKVMYIRSRSSKKNI